MNAESVDVTAGLGGFLAFFLLAVALYFLMRNMTARLRRMAYREEQAAAATAAAATAAEDGSMNERPDSAGPEAGRRDGPDIV